MIKIYHNPRCTKSREGVAFLEEKGVEFEVVKYLEHGFTMEELTEVITKLNVKPIDLVRKTEAIWKSEHKGKELSDTAIIEAMINNPRLIERPIVVYNNKAVVARPTENIVKLI